jgi:hypothetical protein
MTVLDTFPIIVMSTSGEGAFGETPLPSRVVVSARSGHEAVLVALEIVGCRRCPVAAEVDWDDF